MNMETSKNTSTKILYRKVFSIRTKRLCDKQFSKEEVCFDKKNIIQANNKVKEYIKNEQKHHNHDEVLTLGVRYVPQSVYLISEVIKYKFHPLSIWVL